MRIDTKKAIGVEVRFSKDVFVKWPKLFGDSGWSLWDSSRCRQGAHHIADFRSFKAAEEAALALVEGTKAPKDFQT